MVRWSGGLLGGLLVAAACAIGVVRFLGRSPAESLPEAVLASVALAGILAVPGVLAVLADAGRPALLLPVGVVLLPLSLLSFSGILLPLLIPAVLVLVAYARRRATAPPPLVPPFFTTIVVLTATVAAVVVLLAHPDPRSYRTATGGGGTSDVITAVESLAALVVAGSAVLVAACLSRPGRGPRAGG
ncbi:MAG: hypothetical protein ACRD12_19805 [Acidimicrobiales bacterium]